MNDMSPIQRLTRDIAQAARTLSDDEARFLVDSYYTMQEDRKRANNQVRALGESAEPNSVIAWLAEQSETLEAQIKRALDQYTQAHRMGAWMRAVHGIGPVLSAGLLAHLSVDPWRCRRSDFKLPACKPSAPCTPACGHERIETVGHWWRFAGLDPTTKWNKGERRPFNARLKTLCWKIGESFVKFSGSDDCYYGKLYRERKAYEVNRNLTGGNAERAAAILKERPTHAQKAIYASGRLPDGQIDMMARRWAVKLFLSHLHGAWYEQQFGAKPPKPYPIAHLGHAHMIEAPQQ